MLSGPIAIPPSPSSNKYEVFGPLIVIVGETLRTMPGKNAKIEPLRPWFRLLTYSRPFEQRPCPALRLELFVAANRGIGRAGGVPVVEDIDGAAEADVEHTCATVTSTLAVKADAPL